MRRVRLGMPGAVLATATGLGLLACTTTSQPPPVITIPTLEASSRQLPDQPLEELRRPLALPALDPGGRCPVTRQWHRERPLS